MSDIRCFHYFKNGMLTCDRCGMGMREVLFSIEETTKKEQEPTMSELDNTDNAIKVRIEVKQKQVANAIRDQVYSMISDDELRKRVDSEINKRMKKIEDLVSEKVEEVKALRNRRGDFVNIVNERINNMADFHINTAIKDKIESQLRDCMKVVIKQIVETGVTLELGGYNNKCTMKVEESKDNGE